VGRRGRKSTSTTVSSLLVKRRGRGSIYAIRGITSLLTSRKIHRRTKGYEGDVGADGICTKGVEDGDRCFWAQFMEEVTITLICKELDQLGFDSISGCAFLKDCAEKMCLGFNTTVTNFCVKRCGKRAHDLDCREELRFTA
jgi:hypothetical protein